MFKHEHPLNRIDMLSQHTNYEEESDEDADEKYLVTKQDFKCECDRCGEQINWYHRYYYKCDQCHYSIHEFCQELPATMEYYTSCTSHTHTLSLHFKIYWPCDLCETFISYDNGYCCSQCDIKVEIKCALKWLKTNIIHHPSHVHPLACSIKKILCQCDACGQEHKGVFYQCATCPLPLIHNECAFLPQKLQIQQTTSDLFSHPHPLTLAYSSPGYDLRKEFLPTCRVCGGWFYNKKLWIYKCDKCRFYAHLNCATYRDEPFMSILKAPGMGKLVKNYEDDEYPDLLHLPFPDESCSLLKHLFYKEIGSITFETNVVIKTHISHEHPLILVNVMGPTAFSKVKEVSYHNPMKKIQVLCNGCVKPITNPPFYMCTNEDENCNFVLHEWCTQLPAKLIDYPDHPQHPLVYYPEIPSSVLGVFRCAVCKILCNGFVYCCVECQYYVDVCCAFIPEKVTHKAHPNHLLTRVRVKKSSCGFRPFFCHLCRRGASAEPFIFSCKYCDIHLHPACALLVSETIRHKYDKHPMKLSYFPIENHKSDYFCEICEDILHPNRPFYHCHECVQSIHSACAPSILQSETYMPSSYTDEIVNKYVNVKFGGIHNVAHIHQHPLSFAQGIQSDGEFNNCRTGMQYEMILKCLQCKFAIHYESFKSMHPDSCMTIYSIL